jgi:hypothetical protein
MQPAMRQPDACYYVQQQATINWLPPEKDLSICLNNICYLTHKNRRALRRDGASWRRNVRKKTKRTRLTCERNCYLSHTKNYSWLVLNCYSDKSHMLHYYRRSCIHRFTAKFFAHCPFHPNNLVQQIGNYTLVDLNSMYKKYNHERPKHILL